jgi:hypothetical protein
VKGDVQFLLGRLNPPGSNSGAPFFRSSHKCTAASEHSQIQIVYKLTAYDQYVLLMLL